MAAARTTIRWDRLGRIALVCVFFGVLYLYIGPTRTWIATYQEAAKKREQVAQLKAVHKDLRAKRDALKRRSTLEREARALGMVRAGEKAYVIQGLPGQP